MGEELQEHWDRPSRLPSDAPIKRDGRLSPSCANLTRREARRSITARNAGGQPPFTPMVVLSETLISGLALPRQSRRGKKKLCSSQLAADRANSSSADHAASLALSYSTSNFDSRAGRPLGSPSHAVQKRLHASSALRRQRITCSAQSAVVWGSSAASPPLLLLPGKVTQTRPRIGRRRSMASRTASARLARSDESMWSMSLRCPARVVGL